MAEVTHFAVVGAGTMGHGIAQVAAQAGLQVTLIDVMPAALERGIAGIGKSLDRLVSKGKLSAEEKAAAVGRIRTAGELAAVGDAQIVVEAVVEKLPVKESV